MTKLVKESLYEAIKVDGFEGGNSFGEKRALQLVKKHLPFLKNVTYDDLGERGTKDDPAYGQDEQYSKWDQLSFETGIEQVDEMSPTLYLIQDFDSDQIYGKIYLDTVNFNGQGESNDEYTSELDPIALEDWDEERYESVIEDLKEYVGYDEEEWKETKKSRANWETEMSDPNSQWIKKNNYKIKEGLYKGQWEYNWDEESGKWLNIQDRYMVMKERGFDVDDKIGKFITKK